jgi:hypothetical protein
LAQTGIICLRLKRSATERQRQRSKGYTRRLREKRIDEVLTVLFASVNAKT